eukprot:TRINITY_DN4199_c1_g1_i2.p1 TRINITY_DN4199_c1_g1~~TRINITY_DN4199_c1_g1_i2.p1  ORF type:complete len:682 (+),score=186.61 TRINITY_DN4199_c1_g1_i2:107-2152(+)
MQDSPPEESLHPSGCELLHIPGCPAASSRGGGLSGGYARCPACGSSRKRESPQPSGSGQAAGAPAAGSREALGTGARTSFGVLVTPAEGQAQSGSGGLATFDQAPSGNMMTMFRFGEGKGQEEQLEASASRMDGLEQTLDKDELRRLQQERGTMPAGAECGGPTKVVKRKPRNAALDTVAAGDALGVLVNAVSDSCDYVAGQAAWWGAAKHGRQRALELLQQLTMGGRDTSLQELHGRAGALARELAQRARELAAQDGDRRLAVAAHQCADRGDRPYMEDFAVCLPQAMVADVAEGVGDIFACVLDGHAGVEAAEWSRARIHQRLFSHPSYANGVEGALREAFAQVDSAFAQWAEQHDVDSGACVIAALLRPHTRQLLTAWVGDCAGFICRASSEDDFDCIELTKGHTVLDNEPEQQAVVARGGRLLFGGGRLRVEGALQITRSFGDRQFRHALSQEPDIVTTDIVDEDEFLVLSSDGLLEEMKPVDVCEFIRQSKTALDEWYDQHRTLLRLWEAAGCPLRKRKPGVTKVTRQLSVGSTASEARSTRTASTLKVPAPARGRRWSVWAAEEEEVTLPPRLQSVYDTIHKLVEKQEELREGISAYEELGKVDQGPLEELVEKAFAEELAPCDSYQVIVDALVAEAFTQKGQGRDNTTAVVIFMSPRTLTPADLAKVRKIRAGA